jgi:hypothetical protein
MNKTYIARKYVMIEGGARHYYEEGVFSSYEYAYGFIKTISEEDDDFFLSEIVSYPLNGTSPCDEKKIYTFDRKGKRLITYDARKKYDNCYVIEEDGYKTIYQKHKPESYSGKYKVGDIVFIKAYPWNDASPTHIDTIGVVATVPISFDEWITKGNDKHTWDNAYVVDCIRDGYIGHWHVEERGIVFFDRNLSNNLKFLIIISDHYQKKKILPREIFDEVIYGNVFIENVKHFDFEIVK